jgi:hypothetical protein
VALIEASTQDPELAFIMYMQACQFNLPKAISLCEATVASSFHLLPPSAFESLPLQQVCSLLDNDEMNTLEDAMFDIIENFVRVNSKNLTPEEIAMIWSTCRFPFLSLDRMVRASRVAEIPKELLVEAALGFHFVQVHDSEGLKAYAKSCEFQKNLTPRTPKLTAIWRFQKTDFPNLEMSADSTELKTKAVFGGKIFCKRCVLLDTKIKRDVPFSVTFEVQNSITWVGFGVMEESKKDNTTSYDSQGHGFYAISSNGYVWHSTNPINYTSGGIKFSAGIVTMSGNKDGELTFTVGEQKFVLPPITTDEVLIPCILIYSQNSRIRIVNDNKA